MALQEALVDRRTSDSDAAEEQRCRAHEVLSSQREKYEGRLYRYLTRMLGDHHLALDCLQDTFLRAYENLIRGRPVTGAWLYRVGRNRAIDELRRNSVQTLSLDAAEALAQQSLPDQVTRATLALSRLAPEDRELLYLSIIDRRSSADIARMLGTSQGAVRMRLMRARDRFRLIYGSHET